MTRTTLDKLGFKSIRVVDALLEGSCMTSVPYRKRRVIQAAQWAVRNGNYNAVWAPQTGLLHE
jgi:hypothetical protein